MFSAMGCLELSLRSVALTILLFVCHVTQISGAHHHAHNHFNLHTRNDNKTSAAAALVEEALSALSFVNKARVENPHFNNYEFQSGSTTPNLAPALNASSLINNGTALRRRQQKGNNTVEGAATSYSIPPKLAEAARIMAESTAQVPSGNHSEVAAAMRKKYAHKTNDTNVPPSLKTPEGRLSVYGDDYEAISGAVKAKRANEWWMVGMGPAGASPFAPAGYKVSVSVLPSG